MAEAPKREVLDEQRPTGQRVVVAELQDTLTHSLAAFFRLKNPPLEQMVTLDVGGTRFRASLATLCRDPQSRLALLMRDPSLIADAGGVVALESNPAAFRTVLHYLRTEQLPDEWLPNERAQVLPEATEWGLHGLVRRLEAQAEADRNRERDRRVVVVGGREFATSVQALAAVPGSHLAELAAASHALVPLVLDRDPQAFALVLSFLHGADPAAFHRLPGPLAAALRREAAFYRIPALSKVGPVMRRRWQGVVEEEDKEELPSSKVGPAVRRRVLAGEVEEEGLHPPRGGAKRAAPHADPSRRGRGAAPPSRAAPHEGCYC